MKCSCPSNASEKCWCHCEWGSPNFRNCNGLVELYDYQPKEKPRKRVWLCKFHGKFWAKVGEQPSQTKTRTAHARRRFTHQRGYSPFKGSI